MDCINERERDCHQQQSWIFDMLHSDVEWEIQEWMRNLRNDIIYKTFDAATQNPLGVNVLNDVFKNMGFRDWSNRCYTQYKKKYAMYINMYIVKFRLNAYYKNLLSLVILLNHILVISLNHMLKISKTIAVNEWQDTLEWQNPWLRITWNP